MQPLLFAALAASVAIPAVGVSLRYRRYLSAARARLAAVERYVISTRWGAVEYAERGSGAPVLVVHGIFQNCLSGLFSVRDLSDRRFIAASRFGYLGSSMPLDATPAHQGDALAALLDALDSVRSADSAQIEVGCHADGGRGGVTSGTCAASAVRRVLDHDDAPRGDPFSGDRRHAVGSCECSQS